MGKTTGFMEIDRKEAKYRPVSERIKDYKDVMKYLTDDEIRQQAARCMDCGVPFCHSLGCPVHNLIPEWNNLVYKGRWKEALKKLISVNPFPEITGRVCPALCEASCTLSINSAPVTIKQIELAIIENGFKNGWVTPVIPKHEIPHKIAVIGSGPAGLAVAWLLREKGFPVTVYEKSKKPGGILRFGIPDFKLEKWVLDRRIDLMKRSGIKFETGVNIGIDISAEYLKKNFKTIVLATGSGEPRDLKVPGRELNGIHFAMDYLYGSNEFVSEGMKQEITAENKNVLVIGGGDTGSDCVGTAIRQGAKKVYQYEILPKPKEWQDKYNPQWPDWPVILRTSSSHEEGVDRDWAITTKQFSGTGGKVSKAEFIRVEWKKTDANKPPLPVEIPGTEFSLDIELVLLAMGFVNVEHNKLLSIPGVFAVGDAVTGASLVIRAMNHAKKCVESINKHIK